MGQDYDYFWDVYSNEIDFDTLSNYDIVKLDDLLEIIWFMNPMGLQNVLQNLGGYNMMKMVWKRANFLQHWVPKRHGTFYTWIMFGWRQLPNNYPSYDSTPPPKKIELARWVPKAFSLESFTSKQLFHTDRKLSGKEPTWKYYYKSLTFNDKDIHISPFTFYPKFEFYNGVKYGENLSNYATYFSSQEIKDKRELFFNEINIKHLQLFKGDPSSTYRFTGNHTKILSKVKISTDGLLYYDSYIRRSNDSRFTYSKTVLIQEFGQTKIQKKIVMAVIQKK